MKRIVVFLAVLTVSHSYSQEFWNLMEDPNIPISQVHDSYMDYVGDRDPHNVPGSKQYYRWYSQAVINAYPHENLNHMTKEVFNARLEYYFEGHASPSGNRAGGNWQSFGPANAPIGGHNGLVYDVAVHPTNTDIIFIAGSFGLWRTIDAGANWEPLTDDLPLTGVRDVEISESNPNIVYFLSSGLYDYGSATLGVFKSTDGGATFNLTPFNFLAAGPQYGRALLVDPTDDNIVYIGTSGGIFKSTDGVNTYAQIHTFQPVEMYFNPDNPNKIYACNQSVQYSEDGGITWQASSGLSFPFTPNLTMAVTAADTSVVYVVGTSFQEFGGCYKSTDGGVNFVLQSTTPNILGYGLMSPQGGQGSYCLAMTCSPNDANKIFCGGINPWMSTDGGVTWYCDNNLASTHADVQYLGFDDNVFWMGNDGGLFRSLDDGQNWDYYQNMQTSLMYNVGLSEQVPGNLLTGWQDNGSASHESGIWDKVTGGDGFECIIDYTDDDFRITSFQNGSYFKSIDGVNYVGFVNSSGTGVNSQGHFFSFIAQSRHNPNVLMVGKDKLYRSTDKGLSWTASSSIPYSLPGTKIYNFDIYKQNDSCVYVQSLYEVFRTFDAGQTWTDVTTGIDPDSSYVFDLVVSPYDSLHVWVVKGGSNSFSKAYESTDGGNNWVNISAGLPNVSVTDIKYQKGSANRVYAATNAGVYFRDDANPIWQLYGTGLPNVTSYEIDFDYENLTTYSATYGRGVWTNDLILDSIAPVTDFAAYPLEDCGSGTGEVVYMDLSTGTPESWEWTFPGGSPATSNMPSPYVTYASTGTYTAKLVTTNQWGIDSMEITLFVENAPLPPTLPANSIEGFEVSASFPSHVSVENPDMGITWEVETTVGSYGASNHCTKIENFSNGNADNVDGLILESYDLSNALFASLVFDVANKPFDAASVDTLAVLVSTNCGQDWIEELVQHGNQLYVGSQYETSYFIPQNSDWKTYNINLGSYVGADRISIKFENRSGGGNTMYLDNINILASNTDPTIASYTANDSDICEGDSVHFIDQSQNYPNSWEWNFTGGAPATSNNYQEWVTYNSAGSFDVELISSNTNGSDTLLDPNAILVHPNPSTPVITVNNGELSTTPGYNYTWYWDGFELAGMDTSTINVVQSGYYYVMITDANGCQAKSDSVQVQFAELEVAELGLDIYPNPVSNELNIVHKGEQPYWIDITNALGQIVMSSYQIKTGQANVISMQQLPNGVYFLVIKDVDESFLSAQKIIVDRK